ncbi:MAG: hypothetical protein HFH74_09305 [Lachnospiraceae bacterium]|nr:hypothetical protein [Lachnospiraceae bacterium]
MKKCFLHFSHDAKLRLSGFVMSYGKIQYKKIVSRGWHARTNAEKFGVDIETVIGNCETSSKSFEPDLQEVDVDNKSFKT